MIIAKFRIVVTSDEGWRGMRSGSAAKRSSAMYNVLFLPNKNMKQI